MIIAFKVLKDHSVKTYEECIGVQGDHLTDILQVSLSDVGFKFVTAVIDFTLPNGETKRTDPIEVDEAQTFTYPIPRFLLLEDGIISVSVSAETDDGERFSSKKKNYVICENEEGKGWFDDVIEEQEKEIEELKVAKSFYPIVDVDELPTYDISAKTCYRTEDKLYHYNQRQKQWLQILDTNSLDYLLDTALDTAKKSGKFDGKDGADGAAGQDGVSVTNAEINTDGELVLAFSNDTSRNVGKVVGATGADGNDGADGSDGVDGNDGVGIASVEQTTTSTEDGGTNEITVTLTDGTKSTFEVRNGNKGSDGADGKDGSAGKDGVDGKSITNATVNASGQLVLTFSDNTTINVGNVVGAAGKDGTSVNILGSYDSPDELPTTDNSKGDSYLIGGHLYIWDGTKWVDGGNIQGADGKDGDTITSASLNAEGQLLLTLSSGTVLTVGKVVGTDGKDGTDGEDGVGIASVEQTTISTEDGGKNKITITLTNGNTSTFEVRNGSKGSDGADGKDGVAPTIEIREDGYWYINGVNTNVKAQGNDGKSARIGEVTLTASEWEGTGYLFSQVVNIEGVTENTQVDLTPSVQQLAIFYEKDLAFVTENEDGVVTVYAIGQRPQNDYTIQVTMTEVD